MIDPDKLPAEARDRRCKRCDLYPGEGCDCRLTAAEWMDDKRRSPCPTCQGYAIQVHGDRESPCPDCTDGRAR